MSFLSSYQIAFSAVAAMMFALWICSLVVKDASIVDRFWGAGFVLMAWVLALVKTELTNPQKLLIAVVTIWGLRLSLYIHIRNRGHAEDFRYQKMRARVGRKFWLVSLFSIFGLQGLIMLIVAMPIVFTIAQPLDQDSAGVFFTVGSLVWLIGFVFEAGGDWQLQQFKRDANNKGKLLTSGLWSWTRHPNYFGDACQWWGFGLFAFDYGPLGFLTFIGPLLMTFFIRKVSGVDLLEKTLKTQKPEYATYMATTPAFFPRRPKTESI